MADELLSTFKQTVHEEEKTAGKKLKFGIIGTGWIAEAHVESLLQLSDVAEIIAGADLIEGKADKFFKRYGLEGVRTYPDHKSMIDNEELDAVCICTYNQTHKECTVYALEHGLHVMLEKPMCVTTEEALEMIEAEKKSGKILTVGFQPRMDANMKKICEIVQSGELGKIYYIQTGGGRRRGIPGSTFIEKKTAGIGAVGDIGCYSLDMVLNAIGYPKPLTVSGYTSNYLGRDSKVNGKDAERFDVDDFSAAFIRLEGGIILDFRIAWAMNINTPGDTIILGTEGGLRIPSTDCWNGTVGGPMKMYKQVSGSQVEFEIPLVANSGAAGKGGLFYAKLKSFIDAINEGGSAPVPTSQIFYNQAIIDGIMKSAELGREIVLDLPDIK